MSWVKRNGVYRKEYSPPGLCSLLRVNQLIGFGAGGGYRGAPVAGMTGWWRGDDVTLSGSSVTSWNDKSGNARHLTTGTSPTYIASDSGLTGLPSLDFASASSQFLTSGLALSTFITTTAFTLYAVIKLKTMGTDDNANPDGSRQFMNGAAATFFNVGAGLTKIRTILHDGGYKVAEVAAGTGVWYGVETRLDAGTLYMRRTGVSEASIASGAIGQVTNTFQVGAPGSLGLYSDSTIADIITYNSALSAADRQTVRDYIAASYGLTW